ncbi:MAG TPA: glutamine synthetase family protein [Candidatus Binatia bacterium]|nr:glutamine synthetase family protein [Candidatus Binatia bacterium]
MAKQRGLLTAAELKQRVQRGEIETVLVQFTDHYGRFVGKRFDAEFFVDHALANGAEACDYLLTVDMEMNPVPGYALTDWEKGYGDFHLRPDLATLRICAWAERTALVICDVLDRDTHAPVTVAPRSLLRRQVAAARALGFTAMGASELEYYLFQNSYREASEKQYSGLTPAGWYLEDYHMLQGARTEPYHAAVRRALRDSGIPVENSKGEWGRGQHELNIRYAEVLDMADRHALYKQCLKEVADGMGLAVTFMAKPDASQAGSSCHVHLSLWRGERAAFAGTRAARRGARDTGSEVFGQFLAGWIAHARELMPCFAPTVNSYKRYQSASWAPTRIAWSHDNRTAGFRVVGAGDALRIECRIPGADCNPYVAYAAALAAGLDGIRRKLKPPPAFNGDMYAAADLPTVPATLREATDLFERSAFAKQALGADVVAHYAHFCRTEQAAYDAAVTDWERQRYFERI